ncbi:ABC transporter permease [Spirosoma endophyticum]|uniref:FtsX-like permease family protein n=1 Tax=Spirosoma endophyticum TaxID=662367 RepID=A0A1I1M3Q5_9BACT|nr:ABC transporter permease [Spirosoma endophyticum]SFC80137.1 FtsX-like permease family protein [Spirosoma endophyticum]
MNRKSIFPQHKPPRWAQRLLERITAPHLREEIQGDMDELFDKRGQRSGYAKARLLYVVDLLLLLHPRLWRREPARMGKLRHSKFNDIPKSFLHPDMIRNYLKIAVRNLVKNKSYSAINIGGLAVGMAVAMLIGIWINDEVSANEHHKNYETIYEVKMHQTFDGHRGTQDALPFPIGEELKANYPDFKAVVMYDRGDGHRSLIVGAQKFLKYGLYIGEDAIDMFSLTILNGDKNPLKEPYSIVLTDETAHALFGNQDPIGKTLKLDNTTDLKVTAVVARQPTNATLQFDYLLPWQLQEKIYDWVVKYHKTNWGNNSWGAFVQLKEGIDPAQTNAKIKDMVLTHLSNDPNIRKSIKPEVFLHPMAKWRLYSEFTEGENTGGFIKYVRLFGIFGAFILVIACINFMNLSTARSEKRAKEVGVRKAVGSGRKQLIGQFLSESTLIAALALLLALGLVMPSLPYFNTLTEKTMTIEFGNPVFWSVVVIFTLFTGLLAGSYPALYLSSFNPVTILKGGVHVGKSASLPRKILVVVQFTFSVVLMIGTIIIYQQIQYGKNRPAGFTNKGLISINSSSHLVTHFEALRAELLATGAVSSICQSNSPPTQIWSSNSGWEWKGSTPEDKSAVFTTITTNYDYIKTIGIRLKEGRDFSRDFTTDSLGVLVNESAVKRMGLKHPVGEKLRWAGKDRTVVGVVPDLVMDSPYQAIRPLTIVFENWTAFLNVRINPAVAPSVAIQKIRPIFDKFNPGFPFDYKFADTEYNKKFYYEELIGNLSAIVSVLAIFISCLGLFGLASFMAEQRTKEIGIRKVLGASVANVWALLSKDFVQLVIISCLVASPVAWYAMNKWLESYTYKISIGAGVFLVVLIAALLITLLTISYQAFKAALLNPVKSLKSE